MPYPTRTFGDSRITPLCDQATTAPMSEGFPDPPAQGWEAISRDYPDAFAGDAATWNAHTHCFLIRTPDVTVLVDTGVGPANAPYAEGVASRLPAELAETGTDPSDVDHVVITHLHSDHVGWSLAGDEPVRAMFPNARYHLPLADWHDPEWSATRESRAEFDLLLRPLENMGVLELTDEAATIVEGITLVPTPGHSPGHRCVLVASQVLISGDLAHHPAEVADPDMYTAYDQDRERGRAARRETLERAASEGLILAGSHFVETFGRIQIGSDGRRWLPA